MAYYKNELVEDAKAGSVEYNSGEMYDQTIELKDAVCKALRVEAITRNRSSFYLYRDDNPYVLGHVGYFDHEQSEESIQKYCVSSRLIQNDRYGLHNDSYHIKASINFKQALKTAKTFLRPMSLIEMAGLHTHGLYSKRNDLLYEAKQEFLVAEGETFGQGIFSLTKSKETVFAKEIRHLLTSNHNFIDSEMPGAIQGALDKLDIVRQYVDRQDPAHFIYVYSRRGVQMFNTVELTPYEGGVQYSLRDDAETKTYTADTMPEDMIGKLSALNILEKDGYVDEVGYNIGSGMFYVL